MLLRGLTLKRRVWGFATAFGLAGGITVGLLSVAPSSSAEGPTEPGNIDPNFKPGDTISLFSDIGGIDPTTTHSLGEHDGVRQVVGILLPDSADGSSAPGPWVEVNANLVVANERNLDKGASFTVEREADESRPLTFTR